MPIRRLSSPALSLLVTTFACSEGGQSLEHVDAGGHSSSGVPEPEDDSGVPDAACESDCVFAGPTTVWEISDCTPPYEPPAVETFVEYSEVGFLFGERGPKTFDEVTFELLGVGGQAIVTGRRIFSNCSSADVRLVGPGDCSDGTALGAFGLVLEDGKRLCPATGSDAASLVEVRVPPNSAAEWVIFGQILPTDAEWTVCGLPERKDLDVDRVVGIDIRWRRPGPTCAADSIWADRMHSGTRSATVSFQDRDGLRDAFVRIFRMQ